MSNKLHILFMSCGILIGGFVIIFIKGWLFALCLLSISPVMIISVYFFSKKIIKTF